MFSVGDRVVVIDGSDLSDYVCEWNPHMNKFVNSEFTICSVIHFARERVGYCFEELQNTEDSDYIFDGRRLRPKGFIFEPKGSVDPVLDERYVLVRAVLDSICANCCDKETCDSDHRCVDYLRILDIPAVQIHLDLNNREDV